MTSTRWLVVATLDPGAPVLASFTDLMIAIEYARGIYGFVREGYYCELRRRYVIASA